MNLTVETRGRTVLTSRYYLALLKICYLGAMY